MSHSDLLYAMWTQYKYTGFEQLRITFRVAEPEGLARRLPLLANGVTDQGLGEVSAANEAGNPVLCDGRPWGGADGLTTEAG